MDVTFQGDLGRPGRAASGPAPAPPLPRPPARPRPRPPGPPRPRPRLGTHLGMVMALCRKFSNFFWKEASCASSGGRTCPGGGCWQGQQPGSVSASGSSSSRSKRGSLWLVGSRKPGAARGRGAVRRTAPRRRRPDPPACAAALRTAVAVVVEVEVAVLRQTLPQHQVVGDVPVALSRWLPAHQQVGRGVGRGDDVLGHRGRWGRRWGATEAPRIPLSGTVW